jgi:hypothetical protein
MKADAFAGPSIRRGKQHVQPFSPSARIVWNGGGFPQEDHFITKSPVNIIEQDGLTWYIFS